MTQNYDGFPEDSSPDDKARIRQDALDLLNADRNLDDTIFTPPGVFGTAGQIVEQGEVQSPDLASMARAYELLEADSDLDDTKFTPPGSL